MTLIDRVTRLEAEVARAQAMAWSLLIVVGLVGMAVLGLTVWPCS